MISLGPLHLRIERLKNKSTVDRLSTYTAGSIIQNNWLTGLGTVLRVLVVVPSANDYQVIQ